MLDFEELKQSIGCRKRQYVRHLKAMIFGLKYMLKYHKPFGEGVDEYYWQLESEPIATDVKYRFEILANGCADNDMPPFIKVKYFIPYFRLRRLKKIYPHSKYLKMMKKPPTVVLYLQEPVIDYDRLDRGGGKPWHITEKELEAIKEVLRKPAFGSEPYTGWQWACYSWNFMNYLTGLEIEKYLAGAKEEDDDEEFLNSEYNRSYITYVPYDTPMPDWQLERQEKDK
ncbi:MAG: hypothetical protein NC253_06840 [Ruminococcus sp.]|nr:hypothetical protein [Ruminococcus sp.]MCM1479980.1 hypothetical protein [Muribaculaceae bacterium]